jgi:aminopeptidase N
VNDSSYSVSGAALTALAKLDSVAGLAEAKRLSTTNVKGELANAITNVFIRYGDESAAEFVIGSFERMPLKQEKVTALQTLIMFLGKVNNAANFQRGVDAIIEFNGQIPEVYRAEFTPVIEGMLRSLQKKKREAGQKDLADYIDTVISKRGF